MTDPNEALVFRGNAWRNTKSREAFLHLSRKTRSINSVMTEMKNLPSYVVFAGTTGRCGLSVRTIAWTRKMAEAGYPVTLVAYQGDYFSKYLQGSAVRVLHNPLPEAGTFFQILIAWLKGVKGVQADRAVLARGVGGSVSLSILVALWLKYRRVYTTEHAQADLPETAWGRVEPNSGVVRSLRNWVACSLVYRSLAVSEATRQSVIDKFSFKSSKIVTRYGWYDDDRFKPNLEKRQKIRQQLGLGEGDLLVGYVGRLVSEKRVDLIVRGFHAYRERSGRDVRLAIVGGGPMLKKLQGMVGDFRLEERVHFSGVVDDASPWMASFDVAVLASSSEAFALVGIEAMASGTIILAPKIGGLVEYIVDGENGFLTDLHTEDQFVEVLTRIAEMDESKLRLIRQAACATAVNRFAPRVAMAAFLEALDAERAAEYVRGTV